MGGRGNTGTRNVEKDFSAYSINNGTPKNLVSDYVRINNDIDKQLQANVQEAEKAGYSVIKRDYLMKGSSGRYYDMSEREIDARVNNRTITKNSKVWKHAQEVANDYEDVIILQTRPTTSLYTAGRGGSGSSSKGDYASFVVMARNKKR